MKLEEMTPEHWRGMGLPNPNRWQVSWFRRFWTRLSLRVSTFRAKLAFLLSFEEAEPCSWAVRKIGTEKRDNGDLRSFLGDTVAAFNTCDEARAYVKASKEPWALAVVSI